MLEFTFVTLFPDMVLPACRYSVLGRAEAGGRLSFGAVNPRDFAYDRHGKVDDKPYGEGPGMLMAVEPIDLALQSIGIQHKPKNRVAVVVTDPTGARFQQRDAIELSNMDQVVFLCGHYEGFDERIIELFATHIFSIGDFVLTGGELPALVMADAIARNISGVLGSSDSLEIDSHSSGLLSAPQYTKPAEYRGLKVPEVLLSGNHQEIARWRRKMSLQRTRDRRPDLFAHCSLELKDIDMLSS